MNRRALQLLVMSAAAIQASAQDLVPKAGPQTRPILLSNARLHTVSHGTIEQGQMLFENGILMRIGGAELAAKLPADAEVFDASGCDVYPGWILVSSVLGLTEVQSVDMTADFREAGEFNTEVRAAVAVNPDSWLLPVARRNGVLVAGVFPQGGTAPGWASVLQMDGWTCADMTLEARAGLVVQWPGQGGGFRFGGRRRPVEERPAETGDPLQPFRDAIQSAREYLAARAADPTIPTDLRKEGWAPVLEGRRPLFVSADRQEAIESAIRFAEDQGLRLVIVGGSESGRCIDLLKRSDVGVVLTGAHRLPRRDDLGHEEPYQLPQHLEAAAVRWCLSMAPNTSAAANARNLPYEAAALVGRGLSREAAVRSITWSAAQLLGVEDRLGSLEVGKQATFFVCRGDPLDYDGVIEAAFIAGKRIVLSDKQTELERKYREKYRQLGMLPR